MIQKQLTPKHKTLYNMSRVLIVLGILFSFYGVYFLGSTYLLDHYGRDARATVMEKKYGKDSSSSPSESTRNQDYKLNYTFYTNTNEAVEGSSQTKPDFYYSVEKGDQIHILYLPEHPSINIVKHELSLHYQLGLIICGISLVFIIICIVLMQPALKEIAIRKRVYLNPEKAIAKIVDIKQTHYNVNKRPLYRIVYEFIDNLGQKQTSQTGLLPNKVTTACKIGDEIEILYSRENPLDSFWVEA